MVKNFHDRVSLPWANGGFGPMLQKMQLDVGMVPTFRFEHMTCIWNFGKVRPTYRKRRIWAHHTKSTGGLKNVGSIMIKNQYYYSTMSELSNEFFLNVKNDSRSWKDRQHVIVRKGSWKPYQCKEIKFMALSMSCSYTTVLSGGQHFNLENKKVSGWEWQLKIHWYP